MISTLVIVQWIVFSLELCAASDTLQQSVPTIPLGSCMLDCAATASAGPEASIKALLGHLRQQDPNILVSLNYDKCPFFRYGSGSWGQALHQVTITSSSNSSRFFMAYALPNPKDYGQPWFHEGMLVPILVGMDFLSKVGLILDFCDGHAVHAKDPDATPYYMLKNVKGHFMVNIEEYICGSSGSEASTGLR